MASSINASTTAGVVTTADTSGVLNIQTAGTTAISIDASQAVSFTNAPTVTGGTANGVAYLNGSKVLTTGSALVFDGTNVGQNGAASAWAGAGRYAYQINDTVVGYFSAKTRAEFTCNYYYNGSLDKYIQNGYAGLYLIDSTTGNHTWYTAPNNTSGANATMTTTQAMTLNANGALALLGASTSATGIGITFPATQSASSDASTLDDYEEGTWTPTLGGTSTYTIQAGTYVKVGKMVTVWFDFAVAAMGTGRTNGSITGLPFSSRVSSYPQGMGGCIGYFALLGLNVYAVFARTDNNSSTIQISCSTAAATTVNDGPNIFVASSRITGTMTYEANA